MDEKGVLTTDHTRAPGEVTARLVVDEDDTFFFDHPLDHLPGMLVIVALLDLIRTEGKEADLRLDGRLSMSLAFHRFCDLDERLTLSLRRMPEEVDRDVGWDIGVDVAGESVCAGRATVHPKSPTRYTLNEAATPGPSVLTDELVHRARADNMLLSSALWAGERLTACVRRPPAEHVLRERSVAQLVEAARQFGLLIGHVGYGRPLGSQYILRSVRFDLPWEPPARDVRMEWCPQPAKGRALATGMSLYHAADGDGGEFVAEVGSASFEALIVSPRLYQRLRYQQPRVEEHAV